MVWQQQMNERDAIINQMSQELNQTRVILLQAQRLQQQQHQQLETLTLDWSNLNLTSDDLYSVALFIVQLAPTCTPIIHYR